MGWDIGGAFSDIARPFEDIGKKTGDFLGGIGDKFSGSVLEPIVGRGRADPGYAANKELEGLPELLKKYLEPYINQGQEAYNKINPIYSEMATNPAEYYNKMLSSYKPTDSYKLARDEALRAASNTAAAGGYRGNINDISNQARITDALMNTDLSRYMQGVYGAQQQGLGSLGSLYGMGYDASRGLASDLANLMGTKAQLQFQNQNQQNQGVRDIFSKVLGSGAGLLAGFL